MNSKFAQKNKLEILGKLTASLTHEVRNPLSAIKLNLDFIKMSSDNLPEDIRESIDSSIQGVARIEALIEDVLNFSRKSKADDKYVSLNKVTQTAVSLSLAKASKDKVEIKTILDESVPDVPFNENNLLQVLLNLITNAMEACNGSSGLVEIRTYTKPGDQGHKSVWEIKDNGIGIREEDKENIFSEFFTNKHGGTGLGLSVCHSLLEHKNAELNFDSEFGKGSTFTITFNNLYRLRY